MTIIGLRFVQVTYVWWIKFPHDRHIKKIVSHLEFGLANASLALYDYHRSWSS